MWSNVRGGGVLWSFVTKYDGRWWLGQKRVILVSRNYWMAPYLSSIFKILRKENKILQDLRIFADLTDSALGYRGISEGWKVGCITYLKIYVKIEVNTMDWDYNGRRAFDLSGKAHFSADSVIFTKSTWLYSLGPNKYYTIALLYDIKFGINVLCFILYQHKKPKQILKLNNRTPNSIADVTKLLLSFLVWEVWKC